MGFPTWKVSVMKLEVHNVDFKLALEKLLQNVISRIVNLSDERPHYTTVTRLISDIWEALW